MSRPPTTSSIPDFFRELEKTARQLALRAIRLTGPPNRLLGLCLLDEGVAEGELAALLPKWATPAGASTPEFASRPTPLLAHLGRELTLVEKSRLPCALLLIAIDPLATIVAAHGADNGSEIIGQVAQRLAAHLHPHETLTHYGVGQEEEEGASGFAIILPGASLRKASQRAEKLRQTIKDTPAYVAGTTYRLTLSIGVGSCHADEPLAAASFLAGVRRELRRTMAKGDHVGQVAPVRPENPCQVTVEERAQLFSCFAP